MRLIYIIFGLSIFSCGIAQEANENEAQLMSKIIKSVEENHISPRIINDDLSRTIFDSFLEKIDAKKNIFTLEYINKLKSHKIDIDNQLKDGKTTFFNQTLHYFKPALAQSKVFATYWINIILNGKNMETFEPESKNVAFAKNMKELQFIWKNLVYSKYNQSLKLATQNPKLLTAEDQKMNALRQTQKHFEKYFKELKEKSRETLFYDYLNTYVSANDYQSHFMSSKEKEAWDNDFNRSFVGVGLSIKIINEQPIVEYVVEDGPAWKTNNIKSGDIITAISNGDNDFKDTYGLNLKEIITQLKGEKGTTVNLKLSRDNLEEEVVIIRNKIAMSKAKAYVLTDEISKKKIGYLSLPRFYRGSADDILDEIIYLNDNKVEGIVFDLRSNKGGSSGQAIDIMGYFLKGEMVIQLKRKENDATQRFDPDSSSIFDGNLVVMVNERSSSASELFSATMQEYNRAIIVGNQTFGKGTMQNFFSIDDDNSNQHYGDLKLTIGSFYSGRGHSNQYHGVTPDVVVFSEKKPEETGERAVKSSLKFDNLEKSDYNYIYISEKIKSKIIQSNINTQIDTSNINYILKDKKIDSAKAKSWQDKFNKDKNLLVGFDVLSQLMNG